MSDISVRIVQRRGCRGPLPAGLRHAFGAGVMMRDNFCPAYNEYRFPRVRTSMAPRALFERSRQSSALSPLPAGRQRRAQALMWRLPCLLVGLSAARAQPVLTPCQTCCAPGGDCLKAYKGTPGKCCGVVNGQAFCCPGVTFRGPSSGDAKCYNCGTTYRCFTGFSQNVCGNNQGGGSGGWSRHQMRERHLTQADQPTQRAKGVGI